VVPFRLWLTTAFVSGVILGRLLGAQVDAEEKKPTRGVRAERGAFFAVSETKKISEPVAKASRDKSAKKHKASATPEKAPTAIPHAKLANDESARENRPFRKKITNANPQSKVSKTRLDQRQ